jgi:hypothetical protein
VRIFFLPQLLVLVVVVVVIVDELGPAGCRQPLTALAEFHTTARLIRSG